MELTNQEIIDLKIAISQEGIRPPGKNTQHNEGLGSGIGGEGTAQVFNEDEPEDEEKSRFILNKK